MEAPPGAPVPRGDSQAVDPPAAPPQARAIAARVLERVERDGAYAAAALNAELRMAARLEGRERALATELVYGVLRTRGALERVLVGHLPKGLPKDRRARILLLLGAYQLLVLERIPGFAAVNEAVSAVRRERGPRMAGLANAVLRRIASSGRRLTLREAVVESAPPWLVAALERAVGVEETAALLGAADADAGALPAGLAVRRVGEGSWPEWLSGCAPGGWSERTRRIARGDPRQQPGYDSGQFVVQEEGAQLVGMLLGARPGQSVLDACAGRGQKASLLAEQVGGSGRLVASDLYPAKLEALAAEFSRLGLPPPETEAVDWSVGCGRLEGGFDRVLVDAPCTGTGTLRRRPEILRRLKEGDASRLGLLAEQILRRAAMQAKPGGRVVFAVCSVLPEEGEQVVERVADLLQPVAFDVAELATLTAGAASLRLLPRQHGTDGYFVVSFVRR